MQNYPIPVGPLTEMSYSSSSTHFSLWAPSADSVRLSIYPTGEGGSPDSQYLMSKSSLGSWIITIPSNLLGKFYTFQVHHDGQWLDETPGIFCKATGINGNRAAIIDLSKTDPIGWSEDQRPPLKDYSDVILYELHHRDFSMDPQSGISNKGKFLALTEQGTKNSQGLSTGLDHLKELGVTHVHILPSYDFGSIDEKHPEHSYNWGYDPVNYNVPEGSYSTDPYNPSTRIKEFKQMVLSLHKAGIRVVLDVVYNHVFDAAKSQFDRTVPGYFFRHNDDGSLANGSGCGNETASEMPMMRKYMVESVLYWINEYHLDGLRFDLMGIHDIETMNAIRQAVNTIDPSIFIYGEGWAASSPKLPESQLAMKANTSNLPSIAAFGDEFRDALRGGWTDDKEGAFLIGNPGHEESLKFGIVGAIQHPQIDYSKVNYSKAPWAQQPTQMISYVSCHDDMCLADRLKTTLAALHKSSSSSSVSSSSASVSSSFASSVSSSSSASSVSSSSSASSVSSSSSHQAHVQSGSATAASLSERLRLQKLAETAVLTSQGVPFIWCGDEILRDKKGVHNSYNSPDSINTISWSNKSQYQDLFTYISHLINIRKTHKAFHMGSAELVRQNLEFLSSPKNVLAFKLNGSAVQDPWATIIVVFNSKTTSAKVQVPQGTYTIVCKDGQINAQGLSQFKGKTLSVPAQSALIMYK